MRGTIGVGTPHNIKRETKLVGQFGSVLSGNNTTLWLHLASWTDVARTNVVDEDFNCEKESLHRR